MAKSKTLRSTLVQYEGGGYDGNYWEFNYCWFDEGGEFHDIYSSGYAGCKTAEELEEKQPSRRYDYDFNDPAKVQEFATECNDGHIVMVARWFHEYFPEEAEKILVKCGVCNEAFPAYLAEHMGYRGNGGIGVSYEGFVCPDCHDEESIPTDSIQPMIVITQKGGASG